MDVNTAYSKSIQGKQFASSWLYTYDEHPWYT